VRLIHNVLMLIIDKCHLKTFESEEHFPLHLFPGVSLFLLVQRKSSADLATDAKLKTKSGYSGSAG
jgi:hypothetical protein